MCMNESLYQLTENWLAVLDMDTDDVDIIRDTLESIEGEISDKAENIVKVIRTMESNVESKKYEAKLLRQSAEAQEKKIKCLKEYLKTSMEKIQTRHIDTKLFAINIQKNRASVVVDETDIAKIPSKYLIEQQPKVNKDAMYQDLRNGEALEGLAHLEQTESVRIR